MGLLGWLLPSATTKGGIWPDHQNRDMDHDTMLQVCDDDNDDDGYFTPEDDQSSTIMEAIEEDLEPTPSSSSPSSSPLPIVLMNTRTKQERMLAELRNHNTPGLHDHAYNYLVENQFEGHWKCGNATCQSKIPNCESYCFVCNTRYRPIRTEEPKLERVSWNGWGGNGEHRDASKAVHFQHGPLRHDLCNRLSQQFKPGTKRIEKDVLATKPEAASAKYRKYQHAHINNTFIQQHVPDVLPPGLALKKADQRAIAFHHGEDGNCVTHYDRDTSLLKVLSGKKIVLLALPDQDQQFRRLQTSPNNTAYFENIKPFDIENSENDLHRSYFPIQVILVAGDALMIPSKWPHSIWSRKGTVAVSAQVDLAPLSTIPSSNGSTRTSSSVEEKSGEEMATLDPTSDELSGDEDGTAMENTIITTAKLIPVRSDEKTPLKDLIGVISGKQSHSIPVSTDLNGCTPPNGGDDGDDDDVVKDKGLPCRNLSIDFAKAKSAPQMRSSKTVRYTIGTSLVKAFGGKDFRGEITSYDESSSYYRIVYEDGDAEDLNDDEVSELLNARKDAKERFLSRGSPSKKAKKNPYWKVPTSSQKRTAHSLRRESKVKYGAMPPRSEHQKKRLCSSKLVLRRKSKNRHNYKGEYDHHIDHAPCVHEQSTGYKACDKIYCKPGTNVYHWGRCGRCNISMEDAYHAPGTGPFPVYICCSFVSDMALPNPCCTRVLCNECYKFLLQTENRAVRSCRKNQNSVMSN